MLGKIYVVCMLGAASLVAVTTNSFVLPSAAIVLAIVVAVLVYMFASVIKRLDVQMRGIESRVDDRIGELDKRIDKQETKANSIWHILIKNQLTDGGKIE